VIDRSKTRDTSCFPLAAKGHLGVWNSRKPSWPALSRRHWACRQGPSAVTIDGLTKISYSGYRFPPVIIQTGNLALIRFTLSFRKVEDLLAERGILVS
jgi:hypothetical protein